LNLYAYAHNNPLCYTDPDGQFAFAIPVLKFAFGVALGPFVGPTLGIVAGVALAYGTHQLINYLDCKINQVEIEDLQGTTEEEEERNRRKYNSSEDPDEVRVDLPKDRRATNHSTV
jgi:hypothetical protein